MSSDRLSGAWDSSKDVSGVSLDPPKTIEESRLAGRQFGGAHAVSPRIAFEQALVARLASLSEALGLNEDDLEEAIAAFDQAAWTAWEAAKMPKDGAAQDFPVSTGKVGWQ